MLSLTAKIDLLEQYLGLRSAAHQIHASNVANVETPGFKAKIPEFESKLRQQSKPEAGYKLDLKAKESQAKGTQNGNNVKADYEMTRMAENSLEYMSAIEIFNKEMAIMRYAINSGR